MILEQKGATPQTVQSNQGQSARDRAVAAYKAASPEQPIVQNQNKVSPEEIAALNVDDFTKAKLRAEQLQGHTAEDPSSASEVAPKAAAEEPLSSQYAILARKDKAIRQRERQLQAREAAIKARESTPSPTEASKPSFDESKYVSREKLSADPFGILTEMGMTYDQLTEAAMNGPKPQEIELRNELKAMREELRILRGESETTKKSFESYQAKATEQGTTELTRRTQALVNSNPEFETIKETGSVNDVVELIKQTLSEDGILLTVEEASQQVEDYLVEEAIKLAKIKKIQARLAPKAAPAAEVQNTAGKQPLKTLTNAVGSSRPLTGRERALLAFENKLK